MMSQPQSADLPWRDLTDPRRVVGLEDPEAGLKEPLFENLAIPERFGPVTILVDDHKIKRFAFTQDDYSPWSLEGSPFEGARIGQPALLGNDMVQLFTLVYRGSRTVGFHTEEQMWFDSPVKLGETVTLSGRYTESYERRGQGYVVMEAQAVGADGRSIVRHRGVEILRTVPGRIAGRASSEAPARKVTGEVPEGARRIGALDGETRVGDVLEPAQKTITFEQAAVFSRIGEYVRNTHNDLAIARAGELSVPIVQGQQQYGMVATYLAKACGAAWYTSGWLQMKFIATLQVFDPVDVTAVVTGTGAADAGRRKIELDVWVRRQSDGRLTAIGWASCLIPDAGSGR